MQRLRNLEKLLDRDLDQGVSDGSRRAEPSALQLAIDETTQEIRNAFRKEREQSAPLKAKMTLNA